VSSEQPTVEDNFIGGVYFGKNIFFFYGNIMFSTTPSPKVFSKRKNDPSPKVFSKRKSEKIPLSKSIFKTKGGDAKHPHLLLIYGKIKKKRLLFHEVSFSY